MKIFLRFSLLLFLPLLLVILITPSFAQTATPSTPRKGAFKEKLAQIGDQRKRAVVERVQQRIEEMNQRRTDQMKAFLDRLTKILEKIESRKDKAKANGKDVSSIEAAIAEARVKVETARAAVKAQAEKTYLIEITDEKGLKNVVGKTVSGLQKDLRNTHKIVVEAKQAVQKVFRLLKEIKGVDDAQ